MGLLDFTFDDSSTTDFSTNDFSDNFGGWGDDGSGTFWSDNDNDYDFDDSAFELSGTTDNDTSYWSDIWKVANSPVAMGVAGGLAKGYLNNKNNESSSEYNDARIAEMSRANDLNEAKFNDMVKTRKAHNKSINRDHGHIAKVATFKDKS